MTDQPRKNRPEVVVPISDPGNWKSRLMRGKMRADGTPGGILVHHHNVNVALTYAPEWAGVLAFNDFAQRVEALNPTPWGYTGGWSDVEDTKAAMWMQSENINAGVEVVGATIQQYAQNTRFHPVREYLESLKWDGTGRIDGWLSLYFGCGTADGCVNADGRLTTNYIQAVGSRWLVSAVARIFQPGCKADCVLILEGVQGSYKSTALRTLAPQWFTDEIADLGSKDAALQTFGVWLIELSELDSMSRAEVGRVKAFISRGTDRFRPPYGKRVIEGNRQCIFAGSVNHSTYFRDETGGRRFWPVEVQRIKIDDLTRDRDQLWAEAVVRYRAGSPWWMDSVELNQAAQDEQQDRLESDPWEAVVQTWLQERPETQTDVSIAEVLRGAIDKPKGQWTQADQNRVSRVLTALGWKKFQKRTGDGTKERRWRSSADA